MIEIPPDHRQWPWLAITITVFVLLVVLHLVRGVIVWRAAQRKKLADARAVALATERRRAARKAAIKKQAIKDAADQLETDRLESERLTRLKDQAERMATAERVRAARATAAFDAAASAATEQRKRFRDAREDAIRRVGGSAPGSKHDQANTGPPISHVPDRPVVLTEPTTRAKMPAQMLVLVVDDSKVVRVKTGRLLGEHHYRVVFANDGLEAAEQLKTISPDVVITDVEMPGMNGFELARHIRRNPKLKDVPVIMITAAEDRHRADAKAAGVSALLGKPFADGELVGYIRQAMLGTSATQSKVY